MAWTQRPYEIPIIGEGKNLIPTIHIRDLVSIVRRIIETRPPKYYIFAVDKTKNKTLKNIITSISKNIGNGLVKHTDNFEESTNYNDFQINIKMKTSKIFDDKKKDNESHDAFNKRKFQWHCEVII